MIETDIWKCLGHRVIPGQSVCIDSLSAIRARDGFEVKCALYLWTTSWRVQQLQAGKLGRGQYLVLYKRTNVYRWPNVGVKQNQGRAYTSWVGLKLWPSKLVLFLNDILYSVRRDNTTDTLSPDHTVFFSPHFNIIVLLIPIPRSTTD